MNISHKRVNNVQFVRILGSVLQVQFAIMQDLYIYFRRS